MSRSSTGDKCVCGGTVVSEARSVYNPESGPVVFGPGSRNQFSTVTDFYCGDCGLVYRFPPSVAKKRGKAHGTILTDAEARETRKRMGLEPDEGGA